ncbi:RNA demethylase ALKBH10B-like [Rutidosis leptorrhynchoides]|uniref:RNA demethylase ALKBH10B-like n=1 Tax=Rutidosis leptorrhynchoides TaxID=125765 RepID=UPI003A9A4EFA
MAPAAAVSSVTDRLPVMMPASAVTSESIAKDAIISWFRGEFAAANAIIDALCGHLSQFEGGRCEYESVFDAIHRRRLNWIPILQMQKYFSIADVTLELQKVNKKVRNVEKIVDENVVAPVTETKVEREDLKAELVDVICNDGGEVVDDESVKDNSPKSGITDAGSQDMHSAIESVDICSNEQDLEARRAEIKMTKGFVAKESVKGHMVNVVRGLKLYEEILNANELSKLTDYVTELRAAGQNGELSGETFIMYNQQSKAIKRELIQFGAPIFGHVKDEASNKSQDANIEPIPAPLEGVIDHLIQLHLISENRRPNSCIINFFDEGEFSQPFLKPPHLEQPISTLLLSESTMALGRTLVCDNDGNYKGPLMLSLKEGSLLVMRGNSADMARHVMCQSPTKRISVTFFKVRIDTYDKNPPKDQMTSAMTVWQPGVPTPMITPNGTLEPYESFHILPKWAAPIRAPQLLMLAPVRTMAMTPRRLPRGGTGVFLPWNGGSRKPTKHLPPRAQRGRLLALPASTEPHKMDRTPDSGISVA